MESKNTQLTAAQDALAGGEGEGAARTLAADEAQEEVDALTTQVENDEKYISQAEASYADKVAEWKERKRLRTEEIASISKAIEILASDDAKDTMSSSFKSNMGTFFLQNDDGSARCSPRRRGHKAIEKLKQGAQKHNDARLAALAVSVSMNMGSSTKTKGHFDAIVTSIDDMIADLHAEYDEDMTTKEQCEADRMENTKKAKKAAQAMDDETALINRKKAQIADCQNEIAAIVEKTKETRLQRDEATIARRKEKLEYKAAKADDEAAAKLIMAAKDVLQKFYTDNSLALTQVKHKQPEVVAGEAPPPPPSTWAEPYGGAKGESNGVQSILSMIKADVEKDIKTATEAEEGAIKDHETFMSESKAAMDKIDGDVADLEGEIGDAEVAIKDARGERKAQKQV